MKHQNSHNLIESTFTKLFTGIAFSNSHFMVILNYQFPLHDFK